MGLFGSKYKCSTCGAKFKSERELMDHSKIHMQATAAKAGGFRCSACGMSFGTEAELRQHSQKMHGM